MYLLVSLADVVQIHPSDFNKQSARAIEDWINAKYADKIIHKVGLCVCFHSIISASEGLIGQGTGIVNVNVDFKLIVFRPFKGEILNGTITHSTPKGGVFLSMDFFEDIVVPPETLFDNTIWGKDEDGIEAFIWRPEIGGEFGELFFDKAENCLFRVEEEAWLDLSPQMQRPDEEYRTHEQDQEGSMRTVPYLIRGSMMHSGLGPKLWWMGDGETTGETGDDAQIAMEM